MPYYHVLIETNEFTKSYYELDKTNLAEIKEEIIGPYLRGEQFFFNGAFLDNTKVKRILIKESKESSGQYAGMHRFLGNAIEPCDIMTEDGLATDITKSIFKEYKSQLQEIMSKSEAPISNKPKVPMDKSKVFIVHGHDDAAKEAAARFVENLGFKAIILHEQASSGQTIIEKIEANSNVGFAIVLYTPCDLGRSKEEKGPLKPRARQNVVFEHGYLMGKIGRKNVCALVKGDIEKPTDISGVVYIPMDEGDGWKLAVAKEMKKSGYDVDSNKILG
ncbi:MAG: nucleotide-binding protein [Prevotella nanceiensis]|nr:nucleotide-binding protein [Hoylesella nanceiensis]